MLDDLLPPPWVRTRREMLQTIRTLWLMFTCVVIFAWALLPWRIGWQGVGDALWLTVGWAWGPGWYAFARWFKKRVEAAE